MIRLDPVDGGRIAPSDKSPVPDVEAGTEPRRLEGGLCQWLPIDSGLGAACEMAVGADGASGDLIPHRWLDSVLRPRLGLPVQAL